MVRPAGCIFCSPLGDLASVLNGVLVSRFGRRGTSSGFFFTKKCSFANGGLPSCISFCDHCTTLLVSGAGLGIKTYRTGVTCTRVSAFDLVFEGSMLGYLESPNTNIRIQLAVLPWCLAQTRHTAYTSCSVLPLDNPAES